MTRQLMFLLFLCLSAIPAMAQTNSSNPGPVSAQLKSLYNYNKRSTLDAAEKMSEANYSFKPTPEVRSFGEVLGHIIDVQNGLCANLKGEKLSDGELVEKSKKTKAEMMQALKASYAYCDATFSTLTDGLLSETKKVGERDVAKAVYAIGIVNHGTEHYGNIVTYMRLKGLVPFGTEMQQKYEEEQKKKK